MKKLYFLNDMNDSDEIFGSESLSCLTLEDIEFLSSEWNEPDLIDKFHKATDEEIATYGE